MILIFLLAVVFISASYLGSYASTSELTSSQPINGVVMKGAFVSMKQDDYGLPSAPENYIEDSIKMISEAGLNHARFVFYWEAYERDPEAFMKEIKSVAEAADRYGLKIIYDNHQWHTSSWFEERATGFPWSLFGNNSKYSKGGGGNTPDEEAKEFWGDWWDRSVKDNEGKDGWVQMAEFLKKIVLTVDNHSSTLGYEILSEPHVDNKGQWSKIGKFNSFITEELRNITSKTIIYSMNVPIDLNSHINISPKNLAKMAPSNKENIAFKVSVYADPNGDGYQEKRFDTFLKTSDQAGVPLYIGEWNNVVRTKEGEISKLNPKLSELTKTDAKQILDALKKAEVWGTAFWRWDYQEVATDNFNLVTYNNGTLKPTKYLGILEDSVEKVYGPSVGTSTLDNAKENNLINALVKTGKLTEDEAKELVTKSKQIGKDTTATIASDTTTRDTAQATDTTTTSNTDNSDAETLLFSNEDNNTDNQSSNTNKNNPEDYDDLNELIDNIKNGDVDIDEISLNTFQGSGAYQGADEETQDCIDLAGKIGDNLGDQEIVRCSEDTKFFQN
jgi:polyhydroxyalkanoate synthesis regulator phasin